MSDLILLGYVSKAFGTKGAVQIKLFNPESEAFAKDRRVTLKLGSNPPVVYNISDVMHGGRVFFREISDRNAAESLQGAQVFMDRKDLPEILEDEFYLSDLIGARVLLQNEELVGTLVGFSSNNAQTLLEVKTIRGHVASIPLVQAIVLDIDEDQKIITIDPPEGLLEPMDK